MARQQPHLGELTLPARLGDSTNVRWHDASTPSHRKRPNCCKLWRSPQTAHDSTPIFRSFLPPPSAGLPASYNGTPMSQTLGTGPLWATTAQNATFPSVQNDLRASTRPARRWRQVCAPSRHRHSQAATAPAIFTAWQATCACVSPMPPACYAPNAAALCAAVDRYYEAVAFRMRPRTRSSH